MVAPRENELLESLTSARVRAYLDRAFPLASDLERFLTDHFPNVMHRISPGMDRVARINLLIQLSALPEIKRAIDECMQSMAEHEGTFIQQPKLQRAPKAHNQVKAKRVLNWWIRPLLFGMTIFTISKLHNISSTQGHIVNESSKPSAVVAIPVTVDNEQRAAVVAKPVLKPKNRIASNSRLAMMVSTKTCRPDQDQPEELFANGVPTCLVRPTIEMGHADCNCPIRTMPRFCDLGGYGDINEKSDTAFPNALRKKYQDLGLNKCKSLLSDYSCNLSEKISNTRYCFCCMH